MDDNPILEHFNAPYHNGTLPDGYSQYLRNPVCGDEVTLYCRVVQNRVDVLYFVAAGCMVSQGAASMLCRYAEGRPFKDLSRVTAQAFLDHITIPLTPHRQQCALLPFNALRAMLLVMSPLDSKFHKDRLSGQQKPEDQLID